MAVQGMKIVTVWGLFLNKTCLLPTLRFREHCRREGRKYVTARRYDKGCKIMSSRCTTGLYVRVTSLARRPGVLSIVSEKQE